MGDSSGAGLSNRVVRSSPRALRRVPTWLSPHSAEPVVRNQIDADGADDRRLTALMQMGEPLLSDTIPRLAVQVKGAYSFTQDVREFIHENYHCGSIVTSFDNDTGGAMSTGEDTTIEGLQGPITRNDNPNIERKSATLVGPYFGYE